jgi:hypothetical protein
LQLSVQGVEDLFLRRATVGHFDDYAVDFLNGAAQLLQLELRFGAFDRRDRNFVCRRGCRFI